MDSPKPAISERGDTVPFDADDKARPFYFGPKLASGLRLGVTMRYGEDSPSVSERLVVIDSLYGDTLDAPDYFRGLDSFSGELRVFRFDRVTWMASPSRVERDHPAWWVGQMVRAGADLEMVRRPVSVGIDAAIIALQVDTGGTRRRIEGRATHFSFMPKGEYTTVWMIVKGRVDGGPRRTFRVHLASPYDRPWTTESVQDGETGLEIEDIISWAEDHPTAQQNQR